MKELSKIAKNITPSTTLQIDALAKQMKAEGLDVVGFGAGEPDFDTPENIRAAGIAAIEQGKTRYTPAAGMPDLRRAIAGRIRLDCGADYDYTQIIVTSGAKHNIFVALSAITNPGDEIIIAAPYWLSYSEMVAMTGGVPVLVRATEKQDFKITPEQLESAITPKSKAFVINNPSNPTGMLYNKDELTALCEVCVRHDLYIISDEIYSKLVYDGREFTSIASLGQDVKDRTILINGVSKAYAMTGWRIGYAAANPEIAKVMSNFLSHSTGNPSTVSQWAALEAVTGSQDTVEEMRRVFEQRRNYLVERMNSIDGVSCLKPQGAFYVMMNLEKLLGRTLGGRVIKSDNDFATAFLETERVAVVPCSGFGIEGFVRWTYATSIENIEEGLKRLERFVSE